MKDWLWLSPVIGALIGWGTNWLAVRMLFRPRRPLRLFGLELLGLIPRRKEELAASVAKTVESELVRPEDIERALLDPHVMMAAEVEIDKRVREFIARKFDGLPTLALMVLPVDMEEKLRKSIVRNVMKAIPEIAKEMGDVLRPRLKVSGLVEERVKGFDVEKLEEIVMRIARRELRAIVLLGALIGAIVGGVQWALLTFLG